MSARKPPLPRNKPVFNVHDYEKIGYAEAEIEEAKTAFDLLDIEGTGKIDAADLLKTMSDLGFQTINGSLYVAVNEATKNTTTIDFRLFLEILSAGVYGKDTKENMKKVFQLYDDNKTDFISKKDLRRVVKELGLPIDETEMEEMIDKADLDADGLVSDEEFYAIMVKKSKK